MALTDQIDVYCERTDLSFWSEPLNAVSNIAFLISAMFCYLLYKRIGIADIYAVGLIVLLILTGIGSFLFHTYATRWAGMADILPIVGMVFLYHFATIQRVARSGWIMAIASLGLIPLLVVASVYSLPDSLGATRTYIPVIFLFGLYAFYNYQSGNKKSGQLLFAAIAVFIVSMTTRVMDNIVCNEFVYGVHYFWHLLNALTLYLAFKAYMHSLTLIEN